MASSEIQSDRAPAAYYSHASVASRLWRFVAEGSILQLSVAAFLVAVVVTVIWGRLGQAETGDSAIWDYVAQCILRGQIPYRDVVEIKSPGSAYLSALAMWVARAIGLRDILGVRGLDVILVGLFAAVTYAVSRIYLEGGPAAIISFLILLTCDRFINWTTGGTEPKLLMILFGLTSLLFIARDRPLLAGVASMLSCLCWQPGLLFTGTAFLVSSRHLTRWRDFRALKVLAGAAVPLAITVLYFYHAGALRDLWTWTIAYTSEVYAPQGARALPDALGHLWKVTGRVLGPWAILIGTGVVGFAMTCYRRARLRTTRETLPSPAMDLYKDAIVIAPAVYFAFILVDFKGGPYLLPIIPFASIFTAWLLMEMWRRVASGRDGSDKKRRFPLERVQWLIPCAFLALAFVVAAIHGIRPDRGLQEQIREFASLSQLLGPNDKVYVHGTTELLVLLDRPNLNPYIFLDNGKDDYLASRTPGGFTAIVDDMESHAPKVVGLSRLGQVAHRKELTEWVEQHYLPVPLTGYDIYVRKPEGGK
jgi:hypothetical protein